MRMERLLADLEAAAAAQAQLESRAEIAEGVRAVSAQVTLADRLRAALGRGVSIAIGGETLSGTLVCVGDGWCAVDRRSRALACDGVDDLVRPGVSVVHLGAVSSVTGVGRAHARDEESSIGRTWGSVLRAVARSRVPVAWHVRGTREPLVGTIDAAGADHVLLGSAGMGGTSPGAAATLQSLAWVDLCAPQAR